MPGVGHTRVFPRQDNVYRKKESLPYDEADCLIWKNRPIDPRRETFIEWFIYFLIGFLVGSTAFILKMIEEYLILLTVFCAE